MLAIVIVSSGMVLLTVSFTMLGRGDDIGGDLERACEGIIDDIQEEHGLMLDEGVIDGSAITNYSLGPAPEGAKGYSILLMEAKSSNITVLASGGDAYEGGERFCSRCPVNIYHSPRDVRAAMLMAWVW